MVHRFFLVVTAAILCSTLHVSSASAQDDDGRRRAKAVRKDEAKAPARGDHRRRRSIPEFDPLTAGAIASVVAGGTVLVARRRKS